MASMLEQARGIVRGEIPPPPIAALHGGVLADIADAAMGVAYAGTLAAGETFTTLELEINHDRPGRVRRHRRAGPPGGARVVHLHDAAGRGGERALA
ncbi:MAG TPA: hotdog domain-containing protein [Methylomirabilota bacterium]|nr:hotdog domain-containing protein [Methylomirabilota bacterium]